jgi:hypothetical protein
MVSSITYACVAGASAVALLSTGADAHQRVNIPAPTFTADKNTNWNPLAFLENQGVKTNADILGYLKTKNVKSLRDFMDNKSNYKIEASGATFECGYTHEGPCEIWIDNTMVKHGDNCHYDIGATTISYKIDFSSCKGNCMLRWYWFGNRPIGSKRSWQVYKACIPLKGSGAREMNATSDEVSADSETTPQQLPTTSNDTVARDSSKCGVKRN